MLGWNPVTKEGSFTGDFESLDNAKAKTVAERDIQSLLLKALAEDTKARKSGKRKKERFKKGSGLTVLL